MANSEKVEFRFLPLGTFVKLEDRGGQLFMVYGRALDKEDDSLCVRYMMVKYPEGGKPKGSLLVVKDDQVTEIIREGYKDDLEDEFLQGKIQAAKQAPKPKPKEDIPEPDFTTPVSGNAPAISSPVAAVGEVVDYERLKKDPFYMFRKR